VSIAKPSDRETHYLYGVHTDFMGSGWINQIRVVYHRDSTWKQALPHYESDGAPFEDEWAFFVRSGNGTWGLSSRVTTRNLLEGLNSPSLARRLFTSWEEARRAALEEAERQVQRRREALSAAETLLVAAQALPVEAPPHE
jgi:hypothetical protein